MELSFWSFISALSFNPPTGKSSEMYSVYTSQQLPHSSVDMSVHALDKHQDPAMAGELVLNQI